MSSKVMFNTIVNKLEEINNLVPEQRFGQILYNYLTSNYTGDTFYVQDKDILDKLTNAVEQLKDDTTIRHQVIADIDKQIQRLEQKKKALESKEVM